MLFQTILLSIIIIIHIIIQSNGYELSKSQVYIKREYFTKNYTIGSNRTSRIYFPIFQLIEFPNEACLTIDGLMGTCYARTECELFKGVSRGFCARGFGVCCFFQVSCGGSATNNRTHFLNPMFPKTFNQEMRCQISVSLPSDACQLRLNFVKFLISNPRQSQCVVVALNIPHSLSLPVLCGNLTGQHIYMEANQVRNILISITTTGKQRERYWIIEIQFIQCDLQLRAPSGCLQYYTGVTGMFKTMNFDCPKYIRNDVVDRECLMAGLDYNVCLRIERQRCAIEWSAQHFDMGTDGVINAQRGDFCQQNYITIKNARTVTTDLMELNQQKSFDRFCGTALNTDKNNKTNISLISRAKPLILGVTTSSSGFVGPFRGAALLWEQKVCIDATSN